MTSERQTSIEGDAQDHGRLRHGGVGDLSGILVCEHPPVGFQVLPCAVVSPHWLINKLEFRGVNERPLYSVYCL